MKASRDSLSLVLSALLLAGSETLLNGCDGSSHGGGGEAGCGFVACGIIASCSSGCSIASCTMCAVECLSDACPGRSAPCSNDPAPVQGPGCKGGSTTCSSQRQLGSCTGEVTPRPNDCDAPTAWSCTAAPLDCLSARGATVFSGSAIVYARAVGLDATGARTIVGSFQAGTIDLGTGPLTADTGSAVFVARFDASGVVEWARTIPNAVAMNGIPFGAAFAQDGSVAVASGVTAATDLDAANTLNAGGFVVVYGADGSVTWSRSLGDPTVGVDPASVAFLPSKELVVVGSAARGAEAVVAPGTTPAWIGGVDVAVLRYSNAGDVESMVALGTAADDVAAAVLPEPNGSLTVASFALPRGMGICAAITANLDRIDADGTTQWRRSVTGFDPIDLQPHLAPPPVSLARDAEGDVVASITVSGYVDVGANPLEVGGLLISLDLQGNERWRRGAYRAEFGHVAFDAQDHLVASGWFEEPQNFGVGPLLIGGSSIGDAMIVKFDRDGHAMSTLGFAAQDSNAYAMPFAVAPDDGLVFVGTVQGSFDFGGQTVSSDSPTAQVLYTVTTSP